jgi:MoxR-like ATPase
MSAHEQIEELRRRMATSIIGQEAVIERLVIGLLANGNLLVEGFPGLAKTRAIKSLAKNLEPEFSRIQFTPDLLPSDVTGTEVLYQTDQGNEFRFEPGPIVHFPYPETDLIRVF